VLGISAGMLAVRQFNYSAKLTTLVILIALHLFTERYSLSTVIANNRILSLFDNLGRQN
jgi:UDP-GlcNAc:undecaprenyl-phosphate GlcNAc-1-phosphate transferase